MDAGRGRSWKVTFKTTGSSLGFLPGSLLKGNVQKDAEQPCVTGETREAISRVHGPERHLKGVKVGEGNE